MRLLSDPLRLPIEQAVSTHLGRSWRATAARDLSHLACHPAAILAGAGCSVFVKLSQAANALQQFETEVAGLRLLNTRAGVQVPTIIGTLAVAAGALLVMEAVQAVERAPRDWRAIGRALARIHQVKGERFGLETHGFFGPLPQDNQPLPDWPTFYAERRLRPYLKLAVDAGHLSWALGQKVERIIRRLPALCGPAVMPTLLHGDAQQNNFISTEAGALVIDPAVYYGHPEVDLALIDYFEPMPGDVLAAYAEVMPIDRGFAGRRDLWRLHGYLAAVADAGPAYLGRLNAALRTYQ